MTDKDPGELQANDLFGGVEPKNTRERLLFTAVNLFYEHGIHAVGLDRILADVGLTKTTFYNHFESKDELVREALALRDEWEAQAFMKSLHEVAGYEPKALLIGCFDVLDAWFTAARFKGCLFLNAMAEYPTCTHPVHRVAAGHFLGSEKVLTDIAKAAGVARADALAKEWTALMMGAISQRLAFPERNSAAITKAIAESRLADYLQA